MLEKDESSRLLGWPLGVSSEVALMDSAPILRAVVEKDDDSNGKVDDDFGVREMFSTQRACPLLELLAVKTRQGVFFQ